MLLGLYGSCSWFAMAPALGSLWLLLLGLHGFFSWVSMASSLGSLYGSCSVAPTLRCVAQKDILDKFLPCRRTCFIPVPLSAHNSVMLYELCFGIRNTVVGNSEFHTVLSKYHVSSSGKSASGSAPGCEIACRCLRKFVSMDLIVGELNMDDMFAS